MNRNILANYKSINNQGYESRLPDIFRDITEIFKNNSNTELLILADFDRTLTTGDSPECHQFMSKFISKLVKFKPMQNLNNTQRHQHLSNVWGWEGWKPDKNLWGDRHQAYIDSKFTEQQLIQRLQSVELQEKIRLRKHINETFETALKNGVNIIIASAGIDNIIKYFFRDFEESMVINHVKNRININEPKIYINAHTINFTNGIAESIYPQIPKFHIEKEHLVGRMNFLQKKLKKSTHLVGLMIGDSEVDFKIMNDYPSDLQYFIKIAFVKPDSTEKYKKYIDENCHVIINSYDERAYEMIEIILKELIRIRNNAIGN